MTIFVINRHSINMKKSVFILLILTFIANPSFCQHFEDFFKDKTLRIDYIFGGNSNDQFVVLDQLIELPKWAGRHHNLSKSYLDGNGQIKVFDLHTDSCIYMNTFSSLFQEWLMTDEAKKTPRSFENVFLVPFPKEKIRIEIKFRNQKGTYQTKLSHVVDPKDILIRKKGLNNVTPYSIMHRGGNVDSSINVAILAEGYTEKELGNYKKYAQETINQIFKHDPFNKYKDNFNFFVVENLSKDNGVSVPRQNAWRNTSISSHFDTFYSDRYLTTSNIKDMHNILAGIPYEHIIVLANTDVYGGGGIFNAYTLTTTGHSNFKPVVVHEFGHSFGGLADEYFYEGDTFDDTYSKDIEPWEKNITTLVDFNSKWKDMLSPRIPIPTPIDDDKKYAIGVYEGAAYSNKDIYRGSLDCRMKTNTSSDFCPICQRSIERIILFYLKDY